MNPADWTTTNHHVPTWQGARMQLEGQLDVVEYSRITVRSVHLGDPAGGYLEKMKARNSARGHLMAWHDK